MSRSVVCVINNQYRAQSNVIWSKCKPTPQKQKSLIQHFSVFISVVILPPLCNEFIVAKGGIRSITMINVPCCVINSKVITALHI